MRTVLVEILQKLLYFIVVALPSPEKWKPKIAAMCDVNIL
jgi:hypothetical protein